MALIPTAGSSGRVKVLAVTPDLTTDVVDYSTAAAGTHVALVSLTAWDLSETPEGQPPRAVTFESSANAQGVLTGTTVRGGVVKYTASCRGLYDTAETSTFMGQPFIAADLITKKKASNQIGFVVKGRLHNFKAGTAVDAQLATCSFDIDIEGFPTHSSSIT